MGNLRLTSVQCDFLDQVLISDEISAEEKNEGDGVWFPNSLFLSKLSGMN